MAALRRVTIYFEPSIHRALRLKAAELDQSISATVNEAIRGSLAEDAEDLEAFERRAHERPIDFEVFVRSLKRRGKL